MGATGSTDTVVVGRIGRPHGVRGQVTVEVRTDDPDLRLTPGAVLRTDPADRGPLTVTGARWHREILLLTFDGQAAADAYRHLADRNVNAPAGHFYAIEASRWLGLGDTGGLRAGLAPYTDADDVERLVSGLREFLS